MCDQCGNCPDCPNQPKGNYTYVRYASNSSGADFAKTPNELAIERCWQAIINSNVPLDEDSVSFESLFNGRWFNFCDCGCGCEWFPINTPDYVTLGGENSWIFNGPSSTFSFDPTVSNKVYLDGLSNGDIKRVQYFRDGDNSPLVSGTEYCMQFKVTDNSLGPDDEVVISMGSGVGATQIVFNNATFPSGTVVKQTVIAVSGAISTASVLHMVFNALGIDPEMVGSLRLDNIKLAPAECCVESGDLNIYTINGTITDPERVVTIPGVLRFTGGTVKMEYTSGPLTIEGGLGVDPAGLGRDGLAYNLTTGGNNSLFEITDDGVNGGQTLLFTQKNDLSENVRLFTGDDPFNTGELHVGAYWTDGVDLRGISATKDGERLLSQYGSITTTIPTPSDAVLFVDSNSFIKATTYADLVSALGVTTIYTGDGSTPGLRTLTLGGTLQFNHGGGGVNGYFQMVTGGYFKAQTIYPSAYLEYNHNTNILGITTDVHTVAGSRFENQGGISNATSLVELMAGSNATSYLNIGPTTDRFDFYVNGTGKYAGGILGGSGAFNGSWGFGTTPTASAKVWILGEATQGNGTIIQSLNLSPAESILQVRDAASVTRLDVRATGLTFINNRMAVGYNLGSLSFGGALATKGQDSSFLTENFGIYDGSNNSIWRIQNNGNVGHNIAPNALDRMYIRAGAGYDGAINISAFNLANNGYGLLLQGGSGGTTYNGIWSDANGGATNNNYAFLGIAGYVGAISNYGAEFRARNGSTTSIGVWGRANGGDSVNPSFASVGVQGSVESVVATNRRAGYFFSVSDVDNATTYALKAEVTASGLNAINFGLHSRVNGNGATVTNTAGYFQADGGAGSTNIALHVAAGSVILAGLPTYADDAAAGVGGLPTDYVYKTATGELRIKL